MHVHPIDSAGGQQTNLYHVLDPLSTTKYVCLMLHIQALINWHETMMDRAGMDYWTELLDQPLTSDLPQIKTQNWAFNRQHTLTVTLNRFCA